MSSCLPVNGFLQSLMRYFIILSLDEWSEYISVFLNTDTKTPGLYFRISFRWSSQERLYAHGCEIYLKPKTQPILLYTN